MKKSLVILLAIALVFAFSTVALAGTTYSDMADKTQKQKDAVTELTALEIINGYPDGTFQPDANINRAEFCKMACSAAGYMDSAAPLANVSSRFKDVAAGAWYTGWINLADARGYIKGYPDGTFRPLNPVSQNEVCTVLLRLLGYNDNLQGYWPANYVARAGALGLFEDNTFVGKTPATRLFVTVFAKHTLDADTVAWDKDYDKFVSRIRANQSSQAGNLNRGITLLEDAFQGKVYKDFVVDGADIEESILGTMTTDNAGQGWRYANFDKKEINIVGDSLMNAHYVLLGDNEKLVNTMKIGANFAVSGNRSIYNIAGEQGTLIFTTKNGTNTALYFEVDSESKIMKKVKDGDKANRVSIDGNSYQLASYLLSGTTAGGVFTPNFLDANSRLPYGTTVDLAKVWFDADGNVYAIETIRDDVNDGWVKSWDAAKAYIFKSYNESSKRIVAYGLTNDVSSVALDGTVAVIRNGEKVEGVKDIQVGDVVTILTDNSEANVDYLVIAESPQETTVTDSDATYQTVQTGIGNWPYNTKSFLTTDKFDTVSQLQPYDLDDQGLFDTKALEGLTRDYTIAYLDFADAGKVSSTGVVVDAAGRTIAGNRLSNISIFNTKGETVTYNVARDLDLTWILGGGAKAVDFGYLVKLSINKDNAVDGIEILTPAAGNPLNTLGNTADPDKDNKRIEFNSGLAGAKWVYVNDSTVIFNVIVKNNGAMNTYVDKAELVTVEKYLAGDNKAKNEAYLNTNGASAKYIVIDDFAGSSDKTFAVVDTPKSFNGGSRYVWMIGGATVKEAGNNSNPGAGLVDEAPDYEYGDFIYYSTVSDKITATSFATLYSNSGLAINNVARAAGTIMHPGGAEDYFTIVDAGGAHGGKSAPFAAAAATPAPVVAGSSESLIKIAGGDYVVANNAQVYLYKLNGDVKVGNTSDFAYDDVKAAAAASQNEVIIITENKDSNASKSVASIVLVFEQ